ncbi:MAG: TetR/AcrR family transcriptional regulator [Capsulimonadaceae bacterium]
MTSLVPVMEEFAQRRDLRIGDNTYDEAHQIGVHWSTILKNRPMKIEDPPNSSDQPRSSRKPRADGQRNRELIIQAAKEAFTENGAGTSLDEIAKNAGVGAGTLYRHFPSREVLLGAVYRAEVEKLADTAEQLCRDLPPVDALRAWLQLFIEYLATKKIIAAALHNLVDSSQVLEEGMSKVRGAVTKMYDRAMKSGDFRPDINPMDHILAIVGVTFYGTSDDWKQSATRLVDILIQGSRPL